MTKFLDEAVLIRTAKAIRENESQLAAARALGITKGQLDHHIREIKRRKIMETAGFTVANLPSYQKPIEEILASKKRGFSRRHTAQGARGPDQRQGPDRRPDRHPAHGRPSPRRRRDQHRPGREAS